MRGRSGKGLASYYAPREQQLEGLRSTLKQVTPQQFLHALDTLVAAKMMSKSDRHRLIKDMRHILGMSWEDFQKLRKR